LFPIDSNGNLSSKTEGSDVWSYEWNARNELTRVTKNSLEQARFAYDPMGRRVEKVAGGVTSSYTYDGDSILRDVRGGTTLKYIHGPGIDEPLSVDDGTALSYFHADGLGSLVRTTNAAGVVTLTRQYDTWGNLEVGASEPGFAFTGREWDPEAGLHYYRARYYDAALARFISMDPLGVRTDPNVYSYVRSQPVNLVDPSGLLSQRVLRFKYPVPLCLATGQGLGLALFLSAYHDADDVFPNDPNGTTWTRDRQRHCFAACIAKRFFPCDPLPDLVLLFRQFGVYARGGDGANAEGDTMAHMWGGGGGASEGGKTCEEICTSCPYNRPPGQ
jgi:RHS repeat-associated protein